MPAPFHDAPLHIAVHLTRHLQRPRRHKDVLPAQNHRPDLHLAVLLQPLLIVHAIRVKHPVDVEPAPQGARHRILRRVELEIVVGECLRVLTEPVVKVFEVHLLFARDEGDGDVGLGLEIKVPERSGVFGLFVEPGARKRTLAPDDAGDVGGELRDVGMSDHPSNVVADDVDGFSNAHVISHQRVQVMSEHILGVAIGWVGRVSGAAVVGSDDSVASFSERDSYMAELIGCLWEAMDEEYGALGLARGW